MNSIQIAVSERGIATTTNDLRKIKQPRLIRRKSTNRSRVSLHESNQIRSADKFLNPCQGEQTDKKAKNQLQKIRQTKKEVQE